MNLQVKPKVHGSANSEFTIEKIESRIAFLDSPDCTIEPSSAAREKQYLTALLEKKKHGE